MLQAAPPTLKRSLWPSESDDYDGVVAVLDEGRRVISDGVQWILQERNAVRWTPRSYCRTKEALIRCCGGSTLELDALPNRIQFGNAQKDARPKAFGRRLELH